MSVSCMSREHHGRTGRLLIPLPDHFECATASSPLSKHRSPGSDSIQIDLGSVLDGRGKGEIAAQLVDYAGIL
jgi:hypothetical protein